MDEQTTYRINSINYTINRVFEDEGNENAPTYLDVFKRMIINEIED